MSLDRTTHSAEKEPRRRFPWRKLFAGFASLCIVLLCLLTCRYFAARSARDAAVAELRARGELVYWPELADRMLTEAEGKPDGSRELLEALALLGDSEYGPGGAPVITPAVRQVYYDLPATSPGIDSEGAAALIRGGPCLTELDKALAKPPGLMTRHLRNDMPFAILLKHLQVSRLLAILVRLDMLDAVGRRDSAGAFAAVDRAFALVERIQAEPFSISRIIESVHTGMAVKDLAYALGQFDVSANEGASLDRRIEMIFAKFSMKPGLKANRAALLTTIQNPRAFRQAVREMASLGAIWNNAKGFSSAPRVANELWNHLDVMTLASGVDPSGQLFAEAAVIRNFQQLESVVDLPPPLTPSIAKILQSSKDIPVMSGLHLGHDHAWRIAVRYRQRLILSRLALRLSMHRNRTGTLPDRLESVVEAELQGLSRTWFEGKLPHFERTASGFLLAADASIPSLPVSDPRVILSGGPFEVVFAGKRPPGADKKP